VWSAQVVGVQHPTGVSAVFVGCLVILRLVPFGIVNWRVFADEYVRKKQTDLQPLYGLFAHGLIHRIVLVLCDPWIYNTENT
jgi:hypothetical protein